MAQMAVRSPDACVTTSELIRSISDRQQARVEGPALKKRLVKKQKGSRKAPLLYSAFAEFSGC
jgi:hypothetical protein